ncbi:MAG: MBL fold metallo-hydrolase [Proteobacteria bacterium]|nr:MBL fold metallo-hydrolase [Desulfobacula sp.]MBU3953921.1 MBL fold metallo-hydrolase [Pseudomonadota bacterium]MBU4130152.1 MBL fold metallo-hydrolase [Pseudomonadota bacterium]
MESHYIPGDKFPIQIGPHVKMLGNYFFNLFLVTGQTKSALFESGISGGVDCVIAQLDALGVSPDYLIPSHPHSDHITGLPGLVKRFPQARVVMAAGANAFITHPKAGALLVKEDRFMSKSLERVGIIPGRPPLDNIPDIRDALVLEKKLCLDLGGGILLDLTKVEGHSPGNLMGFVPKDRILFCADSLGFHYPGRGFWPLFFTSAPAYIATIDLIQSFDPLVVCPAHQGPLKAPAVTSGIQAARDITLSTIKRIKETLVSDEHLIRQLFKQSYRDEFTLYTKDNILNCTRLLITRAREM